MAGPQLKLPFPLKGVTENSAYSRVPEGFALDALNVVGFDVSEERLRGGKRPGTARAIAEPVHLAGVPVQRLGQVTLAAGNFINPDLFFTDPDWDIGSGPGFAPGGGWGYPRPNFHLGYGERGIDPEVVYPEDGSEAHPEESTIDLEPGTLGIMSSTHDIDTLSFTTARGGVTPRRNFIQRRFGDLWVTLSEIEPLEPTAVPNPQPGEPQTYRVRTIDSRPTPLQVFSNEVTSNPAEEPPPGEWEQRIYKVQISGVESPVGEVIQASFGFGSVLVQSGINGTWYIYQDSSITHSAGVGYSTVGPGDPASFPRFQVVGELPLCRCIRSSTGDASEGGQPARGSHIVVPQSTVINPITIQGGDFDAEPVAGRPSLVQRWFQGILPSSAPWSFPNFHISSMPVGASYVVQNQIPPDAEFNAGTTGNPVPAQVGTCGRGGTMTVTRIK